MASRPRPGLQKYHEFNSEDKVSEEFKDYIYQLHIQLQEALNRIEDLESP